jgi:hypothetical protein
MAIRDLIDRQQPKVRKGPPCETCSLLGRLSKDDADSLIRLLSNPDVRYKQLAADLKNEEGIEISDSSLGRHARGDCDAHTRLREPRVPQR